MDNTHGSRPLGRPTWTAQIGTSSVLGFGGRQPAALPSGLRARLLQAAAYGLASPPFLLAAGSFGLIREKIYAGKADEAAFLKDGPPITDLYNGRQ